MNKVLRAILVVVAVGVLATGVFPGGDGHCPCGTAAVCAEPAASAGVSVASAPAPVPEGVPVAIAQAGVASATTEPASGVASLAVVIPAATGPLPKLIDLGADKCIPCKKMAPILVEAKKLYAGRAEVEFIDVWQNRDVGSKYGIRTIPTQIFFDAAGKEVFRHEGFFSMEDIQKQFATMGVALPKP